MEFKISENTDKYNIRHTYYIDNTIDCEPASVFVRLDMPDGTTRKHGVLVDNDCNKSHQELYKEALPALSCWVKELTAKEK